MRDGNRSANRHSLEYGARLQTSLVSTFNRTLTPHNRSRDNFRWNFRGTSDLLFWSLVFVICYILPTIVAMTRNHCDKRTIITLNLLLGWTGITWLGVIIWSLASPNPLSFLCSFGRSEAFPNR
jgi:uncharacterized membrane protein